MRGVLFGLCLLASISIIHGCIYYFDGEEITPNEMDDYWVGMFTEKDAPFKGKTPAITIDVRFEQKNTSGSNMMQMLLYHGDVNDYIGEDIDGDNYVCCWEEQYNNSECDTLGQVIIQQEAYDIYAPQSLFYIWQVGWVNGVAQNTRVNKVFNVTKTGVWAFILIHCGNTSDDDGDGDEDRDIIVYGDVTFLNAYGQLPGDILGLLPIYLMLALGFIGALIWWSYLSYKFKDDLMFLQKMIYITLMSGVVENVLYFLDYIVYNHTGKISLTFNILSVLALTFKRTVCFLTLLMIASGYTVLSPILGKTLKGGLITIGIVYSVSCLCYEFVRMLRYTPATEYLRVPEGAEYILLAEISIVDFIILLWIFYAVFKTVGQLNKKKQTAKVQKYRQLMIVLGLAYLISLIFFIIEAYATWADLYLVWWKGWWVFDAYWSCLYFALILIIGFMFRPNGRNKMFAYSSQLDDHDTIELPHVESSASNTEREYKVKDEEDTTITTESVNVEVEKESGTTHSDDESKDHQYSDD